MQKAMILAAALAGAALAAQPAGAAAIYSNIGSGYLCCGGYAFGGSAGALGHSQYDAVPFVSPFYASVDQIDVALGRIWGTDTAQVSVWTAKGTLPGVKLASWNVSGFPYLGSSSTQLVTISGISGLGLLGGTKYFLAVGPADPHDDSFAVWNLNQTGAVAGYAWNYGYGWSTYLNYTATMPAFDVVGHYDPSVPEPGTIALVLGGLAGAARLRRRRTSN